MVFPSLGHSPTRGNRPVYGHPSHRGFARAIGADDIVVRFRSLPTSLRDTFLTGALSSIRTGYPERDIYILENDSVLYGAPVIRRRYPEAIIIHLAASDRLLFRTFTPRPDESVIYTFKRRVNTRLDTSLLQQILRRFCDGAIAVSPFVKDRLQAIFGLTFPVRVATPYLTPDVYSSLGNVRPELSPNVAVTIGHWRNHKGTDMLVKAWPRVRSCHPDAELRIIGQGHPEQYAKTSGVTLRGFVDDLGAELAAASLYVHPAYIEPFGVSVVEAMHAGLPAIVTDTTGAKCALDPMDDSLIVRPSSVALADAISEYFNTSIERRQALSRACQTQAGQFTEERMTARFQREFSALVDEIARSPW